MSELRTGAVQNVESQTVACDEEDSEPPLGFVRVYTTVYQSASRAPLQNLTEICISPHSKDSGDCLSDSSNKFHRQAPNNEVATNAPEVVTIEWKRDVWRSWAVSLAALYANGVTWGTSGSISVLLPSLVMVFEHSIVPVIDTSNASVQTHEFELVDADGFVHSKVQLVYSVNTASMYVSFLIGTYLIDRLGCRLTVLVGISFSITGALIPAIWPDVSLWIWWLCLGLANGPGNAVIYLGSQVALEQAFDRRFGTAAAIASLGLAIANVVLPFFWAALLALAVREDAVTPVDFVRDRATGLSLVMFSIVFSYLLLLPMLPLFGSPFFMAAARAVPASKQRTNNEPPSLTSSFASLSSFESSGPTTSAFKPAHHHIYTESTDLLKHDAKDSYNIRVLYSFFDLPTPGLKYSPPGSTHIIEHNNSSSVTDSSCSRSCPSRKQNSDSKEVCTLLQTVARMIRERNVLVFLLSQCVFLGFNSAPDSLSPQQATDLFPTAAAAGSLTLVLYGLMQAVGKMLDAPLSDRFSSLYGRAIIFSSGIVLKGFFVGAVPVALGLTHSLPVLLTINSIYGLWDGLQYGMYSALILSLVGSERYSFGLSLAYSMSAIPILLGSPLAGLALDFTHDYSPIFALCGLVISMSGLAMFLIDFQRDAQKDLERRLGYEKLASSDDLTGVQIRTGKGSP